VGGSTLRAIALALLGLLAFAPLAHATFPGQNGKIAYYTSWVGPHTSYVPPDVYTINSDGSGHARLTADERSGSPIWSPDGMKIVFGSDRDEPSDLDGELYAMNADGSQQTNLTNSPHTDREPAWSPDGRKIVFVSLRDEPSLYSCSPCNSEIYSMSADGSGVTRLTNSPGPDITPSWSQCRRQRRFKDHAGPVGRRAALVVTARGRDLFREDRSRGVLLPSPSIHHTNRRNRGTPAVHGLAVPRWGCRLVPRRPQDQL
jgi:dipeptidyl aminopeptidase/acylaminoacyl peptidase